MGFTSSAKFLSINRFWYEIHPLETEEAPLHLFNLIVSCEFYAGGIIGLFVDDARNLVDICNGNMWFY